MKIRTITLGINWEEANTALKHDIKDFFVKASDLFTKSGFEPRTQRIALSPFLITKKEDSEIARSIIKNTSMLCNDIAIRWFCVPFNVFNQDVTHVNAFAIDIANQYKNAFINFIVTEGKKLDRKALFQAGSFVLAVSQLSNNGFDNFRCGVSFNCKPNGAFFPFTYHSGANGFAIALELVLLCVGIIRNNQDKTIDDIRNRIVDELVPVLKQVEEISLRIEKATGMKYYGIDASLAPHPEQSDNSVAYIVELLGVQHFGCSGTAFLTSFLTDIIGTLIKRSGIRATGFNGVMYSVLEDPRLCLVNKEAAILSIDSLLAFSAMCGCGIDMVPVPGDISQQEITSIMLDVASVALRLNKPLGVRLLPIPGKSAGELTEFDHDFLHNTKIQQVKSHACGSSLFDIEQPFVYLSR